MGLWTTVRLVLLLLMASTLGYGAWWVDQRLETLTTLNRAAQTLERFARQENGDLRTERRRLSERLTQAQTTTSVRESSLKDALAALDVDRGLRRELEAQLRLKTAERVSGTTATITVRDTIPIVGDVSKIQDDWITASFRDGVFAYKFEAIFHYVQVSHVERSGAVRVIDSASLQSLRNPESRRFIPVVTSVTVRKPTTRSLVWDPALYLGTTLPTPHPTLGFSLISYGITRQGQDVVLSGPLVGATLSRHPEAFLSPAALNVGRWAPVVDDLFLTGGAVWSPGTWGMRVWIGTSL